MIKLAFASVAALALTSAGAFAADLMMPPPAQAPMMAAAGPSGSWDGAYIGANIGYGWSTADDSSTLNHDLTPSGFLVGGQLGYNFSVSDQIVLGVEGSIDWSNQSASSAFGGIGGSITSTTNWEGNVVGRLGVNLGNFMPYVDAGVAFANVTRNDTFTGFAPNVTQTGWTAGVGVEAMVSDHLSAFVSYNYSDYGNALYNTGPGTMPNVHLTDNVVKVGLNYHF